MAPSHHHHKPVLLFPENVLSERLKLFFFFSPGKSHLIDYCTKRLSLLDVFWTWLLPWLYKSARKETWRLRTSTQQTWPRSVAREGIGLVKAEA